MSRERTVSGPITLQVALAQAIGQQIRLPESKTQAFSGNSVHAARGISKQRNSPRADPFELARDRDCAPFNRSVLCPTQPLREAGKLLQSFIQAQSGIARHQCDTNLRRIDGCHIDLAARSPVQFHEFAPGSNSVMPAEREALLLVQARIETCPAAYPRTAAVRTDDPVRAHQFAANQDAFRMQTCDDGAPT